MFIQLSGPPTRAMRMEAHTVTMYTKMTMGVVMSSALGMTR